MPRKPANIVAKAAALVGQTQSDLEAGRDTGMAQRFEEVVGLSLDKIKDGAAPQAARKSAEKIRATDEQASSEPGPARRPARQRRHDAPQDR